MMMYRNVSKEPASSGGNPVEGDQVGQRTA
jgi:hypothetical protein